MGQPLKFCAGVETDYGGGTLSCTDTEGYDAWNNFVDVNAYCSYLPSECSALTGGGGGGGPTAFDPSTLDSATVVSVFSQGWLLVATAWALGFAIRQILSFIRR